LSIQLTRHRSWFRTEGIRNLIERRLMVCNKGQVSRLVHVSAVKGWKNFLPDHIVNDVKASSCNRTNLTFVLLKMCPQACASSDLTRHRGPAPTTLSTDRTVADEEPHPSDQGSFACNCQMRQAAMETAIQGADNNPTVQQLQVPNLWPSAPTINCCKRRPLDEEPI
jgi:hypothetical protein